MLYMYTTGEIIEKIFILYQHFTSRKSRKNNKKIKIKTNYFAIILLKLLFPYLLLYLNFKLLAFLDKSVHCTDIPVSLVLCK